MNVFKFAARAKGWRAFLNRASMLLNRYGLTPKRILDVQSRVAYDHAMEFYEA